MKKLIVGSLVAGMLVVPAMAQDVIVYLNNERMVFDQNPIIENGRTLVPLRGIFEGLGAKVEWDGETQEIIGTMEEKEVILTIGDTRATINGQPFTLDVPAKIENGRTLVPLRFISESLGTEVKWDGDAYRIDIKSITDKENYLLNKMINYSSYEDAYGEKLLTSKESDGKLIEEIYTKRLKEYTSDAVVYIVQNDFDKDGNYEAFVFTGEKQENNSYTKEIWFISKNGVKRINENEINISGYYIDNIYLENEIYMCCRVFNEENIEFVIWRVDGEQAKIITEDEIKSILGDEIEKYCILVDSMEDKGEYYLVKGRAGIESIPLEMAQIERTFINLNKNVEIKVSKEFQLSDWLPESHVYKFELKDGIFNCVDSFLYSI